MLPRPSNERHGRQTTVTCFHLAMSPDIKSNRARESPATRLGVLYVASFCVVVLLSALSQAFILRELSWQSSAIVSVGRFTSERWLDRPLSLSALELMAAANSSRGEREKSLRRAILESQQKAAGTTRPGDRSSASRLGPESKCSQLLQQAEIHRLSASRSAEALLALFERAGSAPPPLAESSARLGRIIADEEAAGRAVGEAAQASSKEASDRIGQLETLEFLLFGMVLIVLMLEGLFVISPAVVRIQRFMEELGRSHEALKAYAAKLERSNSELQDFASVASHDLQETLRKVQAFSDRLNSKHAATLGDQRRDYLDRIQNAAGRMQTLINDLLTYSRVSTKAKPFVPTDLVSVTKEVVSDLEARIEQVNGRVEVGELPTVDADPLQVRQLMQNLIGNSLKYRRPDVPPVVRVSSRTLREDSAAPAPRPSQSFCQILVEDNGIGFEEIYSERIFTIFQRLHGRNEYEGTGVGLAVCRKIVERHGGTITARSTLGEGSTFLVTLPVRRKQETSHDGNEF